MMHPYIIQDEQTQGSRLRQIDLSKGLYQETWLQQLLDNHPEILPIAELDENFGCPVSLGRELDGIDNLFLTDQGKLILVETKLWRNPEAHRTVVGQILEYASRLAEWDFQHLNSKVQNKHPQNYGIHQIAQTTWTNLKFDEFEFESRIQKFLTTGHFLLLIVGEKIHPKATQIADLIQSKPHLEFKLAFVELLCFHQEQDEDWPLLVVPQIVSQTNEITRSVIKILYEEKQPEVETWEPQSDGQGLKEKTDLNIFLMAMSSELDQHQEILRSFVDELNHDDLKIYWGTAGFSLRLSWQGKLQTIFEAYPDKVKVFNDKHLKQTLFPEDAYIAYRSRILEVPTLNQFTMSGRVYIAYNNLPPDELKILLNATQLFIRDVLKDK